jgi:hypothetical protein
MCRSYRIRHCVFFTCNPANLPLTFIRPSYRVLAQGVVHEDDAIVHVASSTTYPIPNPPPDLPLGRLPVSAYRLTPRSSGVDVEHMVQIIPIQPSFANRLILSEEARAPRKLARVIDEQGFAPYFVRWSDGPVQLVGDEGDLVLKKVSFQFGHSGRAKVEGPQLARFEWSPRTFPDGVSLSLEPAEAAKVSRVEGAPRMLEFEWRPESFGDTKKATLTLESGSGIKFNGQSVVDTVSQQRFDEVQQQTQQQTSTATEAVVPLPAEAINGPTETVAPIEGVATESVEAAEAAATTQSVCRILLSIRCYFSDSFLPGYCCGACDSDGSGAAGTRGRT